MFHLRRSPSFLTGRQRAEREPNGPVLEHHDIKTAIDRPRPHKHIGHDARRKVPGISDDGTDPVERNEGESERAGQHAAVHEARQLGKAKVGEGQLEEVDDIEQQSPAEVAAAPQVDGAEGQQVVGDKVRRDVARVLDVRRRHLRLRVQRCQVRDLQRVQHHPVYAHDGR